MISIIDYRHNRIRLDTELVDVAIELETDGIRRLVIAYQNDGITYLIAFMEDGCKPMVYNAMQKLETINDLVYKDGTIDISEIKGVIPINNLSINLTIY